MTVTRPRFAFLFLFSGLYGAYGTESAYLPSFLISHGLPIEYVGLVLAAGTTVRIVAGPFAGWIADRLNATRTVLAFSAAASGLIGTAYLVAFGAQPLLAVSLAHAAVTAGLAPLCDALAVAASAAGRTFQYGWVRGAGSVAFVGGTLLSGQLVDRFGLSSIIITSSALFISTGAVAARLGRDPPQRATGAPSSKKILCTLWRILPYRRVLFVAALIIGSHAMNDAYAVISWRRSGFESGAISLLWSEAVASEVLVFLVVGPWLQRRVGPAVTAALAAAAGIVRWGILGATTFPIALIALQATHGFTFALLHMTVMQVVADHVPREHAATAQAIYGTFALGVASALVTATSGFLFGSLNLRAFWAMAALCTVALVLTPSLGSMRKSNA